MKKITREMAMQLAARNEEVYMAVCLNEETPLGEFMMGDFYFAPEPEKPEEPKKAKKAPKKLDHGKIVALRKAGWSVSKIADEMDCTDGTIQYHLRKEGIE